MTCNDQPAHVGVLLRPYQERSIEGIYEASVQHRHVLLALMTGGGKTVIIANFVVREAAKRFLIISHRQEIVFQTVEKLERAGVPRSDIGVIMGADKAFVGGEFLNYKRPRARVQVASIATLSRRTLPPDGEDLVIIIDEAHHACATSYMKLKEFYTLALHVGFTATPWRIGGKTLAPYFDVIVTGALPSELIADGFLVQPIVWTVPQNLLPDLDGVKTKAGDYAQDELAERCNKTEIVGDMVRHWLEHARNLPTVVFAINREHGRKILQTFLDAGITAEYVDGETADEERAAILGRVRLGQTKILVNCMVVTEGTDLPELKCAILARPTQSTGLYMQCVGRILRPYQNTTPIILDHAGCVMAHGFPTADREYSLEEKPKRRGKKGQDGPSATTCAKCLGVFPSGTPVCPLCGNSLAAAPREIEHVEGDLVQITPEQADAQRNHWREIVAECEAHGYKPGWAAHKFRDAYGKFPPTHWGRPKDPNWNEQDERKRLLASGRPRAQVEAIIASKKKKQAAEKLLAAITYDDHSESHG